MQLDMQTYRLSRAEKYIRLSLIIAIIGIAASVAGLFINRQEFFYAWLTSFAYWVTLGLGGLFMTMLHHLTGSVWSVVVRRIFETVMMTLPVLALFFIPLIFGLSSLYSWTDAPEKDSVGHASAISIIPEANAAGNTDSDSHRDSKHAVMTEDHGAAHHDPEADLLAKKKGYLNTPFFIIRTIVYFLIWSVLALLLYRSSIAQDRDGFDPGREKKMLKISAPGMILFAFSVSFAGYDWLMSLDPLWYSTIYGVYFFSGGIVSVMAFLAIMALRMNAKGILDKVISIEHYHTIGKLLFGFIVFWAYMAFSQYLLIWYANIPEETVWYHHRWVGSWKAVTWLIAIGHFTIPFIVLMGRTAKVNAKVLGFFAIGILVMHWVDLYWNIQPNLYPDGAHFSWMNIATMMAMGGVFFYVFWKRFSANAIVTYTDPKLPDSIRYVN